MDANIHSPNGGERSIQLSNPQYLGQATEDGNLFDISLDINEKYFVIGDPRANRVVLYQRASDNRWVRAREIYPPEGSDADLAKGGFGSKVVLDGEILVVDAFRLGTNYFSGIYRISLENEDIQRIDPILEEGQVIGHSIYASNGCSISASNGRIAFGVGRTKLRSPDCKVGIYEDGEINWVFPPTQSSGPGFGIGIAISDDLLLVGAPFKDLGAAWLFDLSLPNCEPRCLAASSIRLYCSNLAISNQFAVVSDNPVRSSTIQPKTLIVNHQNNNSVVLDGFGDVSLDGNLMARCYCGSSNGEIFPQLELLDLSDITAPKLVERREGVSYARISNNTLLSIRSTASGSEICVEDIIR